MEQGKKRDLLKWSAEVLVLLLVFVAAGLVASPGRFDLAMRLVPVAHALGVNHFDLADCIIAGATAAACTLAGPALLIGLFAQSQWAQLLALCGWWFTFWAVGCWFVLSGERPPRRLLYGIIVATGLLFLCIWCGMVT